MHTRSTCVLDISLWRRPQTRFWSVVANDDPDGIAWLLPRDHVLIGLADSGAHVSQLCDACFATDLVGPLGAGASGHATRASDRTSSRASLPASTD